MTSPGEGQSWGGHVQAVFIPIVSTKRSPDGQQPGRGGQDARRTVAVSHVAAGRGAMLETCGSAGKGASVKEGVLSR